MCRHHIMQQMQTTSCSLCQTGCLITATCQEGMLTLFWMQVHEKSILYPLLPISLLAMSHPLLAAWFPAMAAFSMYPLLQKDELRLAYIGCLTIWAAVAAPDASRKAPVVIHSRQAKGSHAHGEKQRGVCHQDSRLSALSWPVIASCLCVHAVAAFCRPPEKLPFLHDLMFMSVSFCSFAAVWVFLVQRLVFTKTGDL